MVSSFYTADILSVFNAGTYNLTVSLNDKNSTLWSDGTTTDKTMVFTVEKVDITNSEIVTVKAIEAQSYSGSAVTPFPVIIYGDYTLTSADISVEYENNTQAYTPGNYAYAVVTGKANFTGSVRLPFVIQNNKLELVSDSTYRFITVGRFQYSISTNHTPLSGETLLGKIFVNTTISEIINNFKEELRDRIQVFDSNGTFIQSKYYEGKFIGTGYRLELSLACRISMLYIFP